MGALLVAAGVALLIERIGKMPPEWRNSIWPVLLIAYGAARLLQPGERGRHGLFFVLGGAWWLAGVSGWISLERTWPLLFVALGLSIMFQSLTSGTPAYETSPGVRDRHRSGMPLLLVAILIGAAVSAGIGRHSYADDASHGGVLRVYSVIGGSNTHVRRSNFTGGEVVSIMGGSLVDLRDVVIEPGQTATLDVFTLMGGGSIRVPESWVVDVQIAPVMGGVKDQRQRRDDDWNDAASQADTTPAPTDQAPHLVVRGSVIMGGLVIKS
jgi:hypothetical protein